MNENLDPEGSHFSKPEKDIEKALRPGRFDDFAGQDKVVDNLRIFVEAARLRGEALDHVLLHCSRFRGEYQKHQRPGVG
jgi:Holliday junction DNA helicase RuvB